MSPAQLSRNVPRADHRGTYALIAGKATEHVESDLDTSPRSDRETFDQHAHQLCTATKRATDLMFARLLHRLSAMSAGSNVAQKSATI